MIVRFLVPDDHPALPGHFPGNPLVPGVVILEAAVQALTERLEPGHAVSGVRFAKFLRPLRPGAACRIDLRRAGAGWRFEVVTERAPDGPTLAIGELEVVRAYR